MHPEQLMRPDQLVRGAGAVPNAADGQPKPGSPEVNSDTVAGPTGAGAGGLDEVRGVVATGVGRASPFC